MKNILLLFAFVFVSTLVQSQTFTEADITGTWQVLNIVESGSSPKEANQMLAAYIDFQPNHSFQIRMRKDGKKEFDNKFQNAKWNYTPDNQTISVNNGEMLLQPVKEDGKIIFILPGKGIKLEVVMPM